MTAELLCIVVLLVAWLLTLAFWRLDIARAHVREDKLLDRIQSQVPAVLERQDAHEERKAAMVAPKETYDEEKEDEKRQAEIAALLARDQATPAEGRTIVRGITG